MSARHGIGLIGGAESVDHACDVSHQRGVFEQQPQLGIGKGRAQIKVQRADDGLRPVDHEHLGMQHIALAALFRQRREFMDHRARRQQRAAVAPVGTIHQQHVGRRQRVGQKANPDSPGGKPGQARYAGASGHEIRRDQPHLCPGAGQDAGDGRRHPGGRVVAVCLVRRVGQKLHLGGPVQPPCQHRLSGAPAQRPGDVTARPGGANLAIQPDAEFAKVHPESGPERKNRQRKPEVPVAVEQPRDLIHLLPHQQHVGVNRSAGVCVHRAKVCVADIAPADNRQPSVGDPQLAMHPAIEARQPQQHLDGAPQRMAPVARRVEQPHLDQRVCGQREEGPVEPLHIHIIQQKPDADAPVRGLDQTIQQQPAGHIGAPDVVHQVQTAPRL